MKINFNPLAGVCLAFLATSLFSQADLKPKPILKRKDIPKYLEKGYAILIGKLIHLPVSGKAIGEPGVELQGEGAEKPVVIIPHARIGNSTFFVQALPPGKYRVSSFYYGVNGRPLTSRILIKCNNQTEYFDWIQKLKLNHDFNYQKVKFPQYELQVKKGLNYVGGWDLRPFFPRFKNDLQTDKKTECLPGYALPENVSVSIPE